MNIMRNDKDALASEEEEREELLALLIHDVKTGLSGQGRLLEMLLKGRMGELSPSQQQLMQIILTSNASLTLTLQNFLEVYRLDSTRHGLQLFRIDLRDCIISSMEELQALAKLHDIQFELLIADDPVIVEGDSLAIKRVVKLLIDNAISFSSSGATITIKVEQNDNVAHIHIIDDGQGITPEQLEILFNICKPSDSPRRKYTNGVGLYLCRKILEAQGGTIACQSQVDCGTVMTITFPLAK